VGAQKEIEGYGPVFIFMTYSKKEFLNLDLNAQFFFDLPFQTLFQGLTILLFSARKLPKPGEMTPFGSFCDQ
jgi:hypothetical protein